MHGCESKIKSDTSPIVQQDDHLFVIYIIYNDYRTQVQQEMATWN